MSELITVREETFFRTGFFARVDDLLRSAMTPRCITFPLAQHSPGRRQSYFLPPTVAFELPAAATRTANS